MSERVDRRLAALRALSTGTPFDLGKFGTSLEAACQTALPHLTGDPDLDIVRVSMFRGDGEVGSDYEFEGYAEEETRRLWCAIDNQDGGIEVCIAITSGNEWASCELFGKSGPNIGNLALFARIFDLTLESALACGLKEIRNQPNNELVRRLYRRTGFKNGEILDLNDSESLLRALRFIEAAYAGAASRHPRFTPPW